MLLLAMGDTCCLRNQSSSTQLHQLLRDAPGNNLSVTGDFWRTQHSSTWVTLQNFEDRRGKKKRG